MTAIVLELSTRERRIAGRPYSVYYGNRVVDEHVTLAGANNAANMLNSGSARVNPHRCVGSRVELV